VRWRLVAAAAGRWHHSGLEAVPVRHLPGFAMIAFDRPGGGSQPHTEKNVLGGPLASCSREPLTGFFRDGSCRTCAEDTGSHTVCAVMTKEFLAFTVKAGNDLVTPQPQWDFPGLVAGDHWCLCAARWLEAAKAGHAPLVVLEATHEKALEIVPLELLQRHAAPAA
jgi:uncharacterized protein (DUF2237 family)